MLDGVFQHRAGIAEQTGVFQSADAPPDDRLFASVIPMHPAKNLAAVAADNYLSKAVIAAEGSGLSVRTGVDNASADKLLLHLHEYFTRNNGFVAVFYIILRNDTVVLDPLFCKEVNRIGFL